MGAELRSIVELLSVEVESFSALLKSEARGERTHSDLGVLLDFHTALVTLFRVLVAFLEHPDLMNDGRRVSWSPARIEELVRQCAERRAEIVASLAARKSLTDHRAFAEELQTFVGRVLDDPELFQQMPHYTFWGYSP